MADMNAMPSSDPAAMPPAEGEATSDDLVTLIAAVSQETVMALFQDPEFLGMARKALGEMKESPEMEDEDPMAGLDELDSEDPMAGLDELDAEDEMM